MTGKNLRLEKLFDRSNHAVVIAADHGEFDGPIPGMINLKETLQKINPVVDGVLLSPGMLKQCREVFNKKGAPMPIVRLNWSTVYCFHWRYQQARTVPACSVADAVALGAEMVLVSLTLKTGDEAVDAKNVQVFCRLIREAEHLGIPAIGEFFPNKSEKLSSDEMQEQVYVGARILAELGADLLKTFYTKEFAKVTSATPVPILGLGAEKKPTQLEALQLAHDEIVAGARGVVFGRNAIQVARPFDFQAALCKVVKEKMTPADAVKNYQLKE